jgi:hypothetical protein
MRLGRACTMEPAAAGRRLDSACFILATHHAMRETAMPIGVNLQQRPRRIDEFSAHIDKRPSSCINARPQVFAIELVPPSPVH